MAGTGAGEKKAAPEPARDHRSNHLLCALNFVQKDIELYFSESKIMNLIFCFNVMEIVGGM